ncbi:MAG: flagellar motor switch protein FliM [Ruminiclostridium sp.]|nr:flagellar motor switch protein FliM [Ruminiclostridium sp.]
MAETLTQEQIDALLSSAMSGGVVESSKEPDVKEYDFRAPKKFTKERIKILDSIFDNYARLLSSYLTGLLRLYCKVTLASIEEQRYFEFNNALPDYVMMGTLDLGIHDDDIGTVTSIVQLSNSLTYTLIDRLLGGRGEYKDADRDFTEIEVSIIDKIINNMAALLREPWEPYLEVNPTVVNIETNSRVYSAVDYDDTMILVALEATVNDTKTIITICMPVLSLDEVMQKYMTRSVRTTRRFDAAREQERRDHIMKALNETSLEITAVLGNTSLDVYDVLNLQVDDIIPLDMSIDSNVKLRIGNKIWFDGKLGSFNQNKAIKIENVYRSEV